jgi:hypothetical protein
MNTQESAALLSIAAAFDNRKPDADAAMAWSVALDGIRFEDARDAIVKHYRVSSEWLMPAKVIAEVKRIRDKRIDDHPPLTPPAGPEGESDADLERRQRAWLKEARWRIGNGETIDCDVAYGELKKRNLPDLRAIVAKPESAA